MIRLRHKSTDNPFHYPPLPSKPYSFNAMTVARPIPEEEPVPESHPTNPRLLTKAGKTERNIIGIFLFLGWLALFILGLSLEASTFRAAVISDDIIRWNYLALYAVSLTPTNVALLASLAGALGGISSNLAMVL